MTKEDIDTHMDGKLALLIVDRSGDGSPVPMSRRDLAKELGVDNSRLLSIEKEIFRKLRRNPIAWDAMTSAYRHTN